MTSSMLNLRVFIKALYEANEIVEIHEEVDPYLELAEIHRRIAAANGPALLFKNVKGSSFPVVTNLFGSQKRVQLAFQNRPEELISHLISLLVKDFPPKPSQLWKNRSILSKLFKVGLKKSSSFVLQEKMKEVDLEKLPILTSWPEDGGPFLTLPLVYTESPHGSSCNLGMYRIQRFNKKETGLHFQIGKGGGFHFYEAEAINKSLPVNIMLGGPPALIMSAITPLPENVPELVLASLLQGEKLAYCRAKESPYPIVSHAEFVLIGEAKPHQRRLEGPFGDHYGYYSLAHDFPVFECSAIYHRKDAIYPATIVGKPRQEDFYIGNYLQELLSPLFPIVMPSVKSLWSYGETGFHALSAAVVKERYERECMSAAFRILGEGQLSLTKFLLITNIDIDLKNIKLVLKTILERFSPEKDLYIFSNLSLDTLDYTGPKLNHGSRGVLIGVGPVKRQLKEQIDHALPLSVIKAQPFCCGTLVIEISGSIVINDLLQHAGFQDWPLVIIVDDVEKTIKNDATFLWTVFMRFEPAADIYSANEHIFRHHIVKSGSIAIDARMKPTYPKVVEPDSKTYEMVSKRWGAYFPKGQEMGDSIQASL